MKPTSTRKLVYSALCLALALLLPFLTGQIQQFGSMLAPMHLPVLLAAGCGAGAAIGLLGGIITERIRGLWESGV